MKFMAFTISKWSLQAAHLGDIEFVSSEKKKKGKKKPSISMVDSNQQDGELLTIPS